MKPRGCPETSLTVNQHCVTTLKSEYLIFFSPKYVKVLPVVSNRVVRLQQRQQSAGVFGYGGAAFEHRPKHRLFWPRDHDLPYSLYVNLGTEPVPQIWPQSSPRIFSVVPRSPGLFGGRGGMVRITRKSGRWRGNSVLGVTYKNNQLDALNFIISVFQASTCFEHMCSSSGGQNCIIQSLVSSHL